MKLLAFGDLHLGHGPGYGRTPADRLHDQQEVLGRIAGIAVEHDVDVILNTGDTFEGPGITPEQLEVFAAFVDACHTVGIPIVAITGNGKHDAAMRTTNAVDIFRHIPGITVSSRPQLIDVAGVTIATLPWVHPGRLIAARNGQVDDRDEVNREVAGLLVATARGLRAQIPDGRPAILALHGSVSGAETPDGALTDLFQEPVLDAFELQELGFDAIVCGHIHKPQQLGENIPFLYVGSPMPLNFGEAGCKHGVTILEFTETGAWLEADFVEIQSRPFVTIDLDFTAQPGDVDVAINRTGATFQDVDDAVVRLRVRATAAQGRRLDFHALRDSLLQNGAHVVKIEPDIVREDRIRVDGVNEDLQPLDAYDLYATANELEPELALRARVRLAEHLEAVS